MLTFRVVYFLHFLSLGIFLPYLNVHFRDIGMTNAQIGILTAVMPLFITLSPTIWAQIADRTGRKKDLIVLASALSGAFFLLLGSMRQFGYALLVLACFSFFRSPIASLFESMTFEQLKKTGGDYGRTRMFGSFGFIVGVVVIGHLFERWGARVLFLGLFLASVTSAANAAFLPAAPRRVRAEKRPPVSSLFTNRLLVLFLATAFLMRLSHAGYTTFYSIYLDSLGVSRDVIGVAWSLGVLCEVGVLVSSGRIAVRFGLQGLILLALGAAMLRWTLFATVTTPWILVAAQSLHGLTFSAFHVGGVTLVNSVIPDELRATGQGLFISMAYGLGGIVGAFLAGLVANAYGIPVVFGASVGVAFASACLFLIAVRPRLRGLSIIGLGASR